MKLIIFGATGSVGKKLVEQALSQGHQVTAFARTPEKAFGHLNVTTVSGDVLDPHAVTNAIHGHDAAMVVLGAGRKGGVRSAGTQNIVDAMKEHGVSRLICETTLGAGDSRPALNFFWKYIMFGMFLRPAYADHQTQELIVQNSDLEWTIVRPAAFTDGPRTGRYKHGFPATTKNLKLKISRSDVADFMLRQLNSRSYVHKAPGLSY
jgi:putative NADH-flavin reductase